MRMLPPPEMNTRSGRAPPPVNLVLLTSILANTALARLLLVSLLAVTPPRAENVTVVAAFALRSTASTLVVAVPSWEDRVWMAAPDADSETVQSEAGNAVNLNC